MLEVDKCPLCGSENIEWMGDAFEEGNLTPFHCHQCDSFFGEEDVRRKKLMENAESLADEFTSRVLETKYGERFKKLDNLEDDKELNDEWEYFNDKFYDIISGKKFDDAMLGSVKKKIRKKK
jgi:hypothetical protein